MRNQITAGRTVLTLANRCKRKPIPREHRLEHKSSEATRTCEGRRPSPAAGDAGHERSSAMEADQRV